MFIFIMLRKYTPEMRKLIIDYMLEHIPKIGLVVINGIQDLMLDINNTGESSKLINLLMRWSGRYNLHIYMVLHLNKSDDNTRGHIGMELNNKSETVLQVSKSDKDSNISEVKAMHIRDREFNPFAFRINKESPPEIIHVYEFKQKGRQERGIILSELPVEKHRQALETAFGGETILVLRT